MALAAQEPFAIEDDETAHQLTAEDSRESSRVQQSVIEETVGAGYLPRSARRCWQAGSSRSAINGVW